MCTRGRRARIERACLCPGRRVHNAMPTIKVQSSSFNMSRVIEPEEGPGSRIELAHLSAWFVLPGRGTSSPGGSGRARAPKAKTKFWSRQEMHAKACTSTPFLSNLAGHLGTSCLLPASRSQCAQCVAVAARRQTLDWTRSCTEHLSFALPPSPMDSNMSISTGHMTEAYVYACVPGVGGLASSGLPMPGTARS